MASIRVACSSLSDQRQEEYYEEEEDRSVAFEFPKKETNGQSDCENNSPEQQFVEELQLQHVTANDVPAVLDALKGPKMEGWYLFSSSSISQ